FALWLVTFVMLAILLEFWKGISARVKSRGESAFTALIKLISRNHRRYGGYIIHLGVVMIALGFIGDYYFKEETQGTVSVGETLQLADYELRFNNLDFSLGSDGREVLEASTTLFRDGQPIRELKPRR
ncbi:MAG: hypothetical protein GWN30_02985, partial [Gammaproteobacteria bacterium]|nr:hypothetical protein [Gammaproteobacteria bacterium]